MTAQDITEILYQKKETREERLDAILSEHTDQLIHNFIDGYWFRLGDTFNKEHTKLDQDGKPLPKPQEQLQLF